VEAEGNDPHPVREEAMPRVIVTTDPLEGQRPRTVLDESVDPWELDSDQSAAGFIERLGWSIVAAQDDEEVHGSHLPG
jgi:hypothetical protein